MLWFWISAALAFALGIYIGLGHPGLNFGGQDRVVPGGRRRPYRRMFTPLDLLRRRESERRFTVRR